jgi:hypothetical protein
MTVAASRDASREQIPDAPLIRLRRSGVVWTLEVRCPHCGREHAHGGGTDTQPSLGHRVAHCHAGGGYVITDPHGLCP